MRQLCKPLTGNKTNTYKSTINDNDPDAMRSDMFMITLIAGWHSVI